MKKILLIPALLAISACTNNPLVTNQQNSPTPLIYQKAAIPKVNLTLPTQISTKKRHHSIIELGKPSLTLDDPKENNTKQGFFPRIAGYIKKGIASWYGPGFHGKKTANGEIFNMYEMTAAHKTLPLASYAKVTNLKNHRTVVVRINDRGPYVGKRVVDLSYAAAKKIGIQGTGNVEIKTISSLEALPDIQKVAESRNKKVFLQVGSFGNQSKALNLQNKIAATALPTSTIQTSTNKQNGQYKVQLGPIKSSETAEQVSYQLAKMGINDPKIIIASREY